MDLFNMEITVLTVSIIKLFILVAVGYAVFAKKIIDRNFVDRLGILLIKVIFPCMIIAKMTGHFDFNVYDKWYLMPVIAIGFSVLGAIMAWPLKRAIGYEVPSKEFISTVAFQNSGYLPLTLIMFSFAGELRNELYIYLFLYLVGFNILVWSFVPLIFDGKFNRAIIIKHLFNPPLIATVFSVIWVAVFGKGAMPGVIVEPLKSIGNAAFPLAMMVLGAYLCMYKAFKPEKPAPVFTAIFLKLICFPVVMIILLKVFSPGETLSFFLFLESIMPTAVSLVVIGSYTKADNSFISSVIFYTHLIGFITIPCWLFIYSKLV